jgi:tRNA-Thr(GGU) m(6)t(6)A37 methyltransferase TsaA
MPGDNARTKGFELKQIGVVHSSFRTREQVRQSNKDENVAEVEIFAEYADGLDDIEGFSHIIVLCWMHKSDFHSLKVRPLYHPDKLRGIFSTRHPDRPNPIAVTVLELLKRRKNVLKVKGIDMLDETPVLDIKPYTRRDKKEGVEFGWLSDKKYP